MAEEPVESIEAQSESDGQMTEENVSLEDVVEAPRKDSAREQRKFARYRVKLTANIRLSDGDIARVQAVDISMGGIYVEYAAPADKGRVFEMFFDLPFKDEFQRVFVKAEVVRCIVIGNRNLYGIALNFTEYARHAEDILDKYMHMRGRASCS